MNKGSGRGFGWWDSGIVQSSQVLLTFTDCLAFVDIFFCSDLLNSSKQFRLVVFIPGDLHSKREDPLLINFGDVGKNNIKMSENS